MILVISIGSRVYSYKSEYLSKYNSKYWEDRYFRSQWVGPSGCNWDPHINPKTCVWDDAWYVAHPVANYKPMQREFIGDDGLYAYAGWEYIHGKDPTLLNAEMPPLGKYLIGLSILVFDNQNIFAIFSGILVLLAYFLLNLQIFKHKTLALLPVVLLSFEPIFYTQLRAPFLDLLYLSLLLFTFYFFLKEKFLFSVISLGLMMATKASLGTFITVVATVMIYLFFYKKFKFIKKFVFFLPVAFITFALTYFRFFWLGHGIREFLGVQKWIVNFYSEGAKANFGSAWEMLIIGRWQTWWDKTIVINEWQITWPIIFLLSILLLYLMIRKKYFHKCFLFLIWVFIYLSFLSTLPVFPRYLLLVLPFLYSLSTYVLFNFIFKKYFTKVNIFISNK